MRLFSITFLPVQRITGERSVRRQGFWADKTTATKRTKPAPSAPHSAPPSREITGQAPIKNTPIKGYAAFPGWDTAASGVEKKALTFPGNMFHGISQRREVGRKSIDRLSQRVYTGGDRSSPWEKDHGQATTSSTPVRLGGHRHARFPRIFGSNGWLAGGPGCSWD